MVAPAIQTVRTTEELFFPDSTLRGIMGLKPGDIILEIKRASAGYGKGHRLDLAGCLVTVLKGDK